MGVDWEEVEGTAEKVPGGRVRVANLCWGVWVTFGVPEPRRRWGDWVKSPEGVALEDQDKVWSGEGREEFVGMCTLGVASKGVPLSLRERVNWAEAVGALGVEREVFEAEEEGDMELKPPLGEQVADTEYEVTPEELGLRDPPPFPPTAPDDTLGTLESLAVKLSEVLGLWELEEERRGEEDLLGEEEMEMVREGVGVNKGGERVGVGRDERVAFMEV